METLKQFCRLCYYETTDIIDIFSEKGSEIDLCGKIKKYLYLQTIVTDDLPSTICWMCSQHLETFDKFYSKINEIQRSRLKENYEKVALQPIYKTVNYDLEIILDENHSSKIENDIIIEPPLLIKEATTSVHITNDSNTLERENEILNLNVNEKKHSEQNVINSNRPKRQRKQVQITNENEVRITPIRQTRVLRKNKNEINIKEEGRPPKVANTTPRATETTTEQISKSQVSIKKSKFLLKKSSRKKKDETFKVIHCDIPMHDIDDKIESEGESNDEFPTRDSDNEDWPTQKTLNEFPKEIIKDGLLLLKGQRLMTLICRFYRLKCDLCPKGSQPKFKILRELFLHHLHEHETVGYVECCQTKFSRYPAIIMHMARHLQPEAFKCDECGYVVTRPRFLNIHKKTHLPEELKPYGCDTCSRRFCWKGALQIHMISHQAPEERKQYNCPFCSKVYDTPGGLSTHKNLTHTTKKKNNSNICHICAKTFATRTGLNEHMTSIHQPRENSQLQCAVCDKWLMNRRCLKSHMLLHSDIEFECESCDYKTKKRELLKRHTVTQHSDLKPFKCHCGKSFKLKRTLTVHQNHHNITQTFTCPFCPKTFNSSTNFYSHRKNSHPMELEELKRRSLEQQREKRIKAGVEVAAAAATASDIDYASVGEQLGDEETVLYEIIIPSENVKNKNNDLISIIGNDNEDGDDDDDEPDNHDDDDDDDDKDESKEIEIIPMNEEEFDDFPSSYSYQKQSNVDTSINDDDGDENDDQMLNVIIVGN